MSGGRERERDVYALARTEGFLREQGLEGERERSLEADLRRLEDLHPRIACVRAAVGKAAKIGLLARVVGRPAQP